MNKENFSVNEHCDLPLWSMPMAAVLGAQFLSALADNALLISAIALVKQAGNPKLIPILQEFFLVPYIMLAPFVGPFADSLSKGRVMMLGNGLKFVGAVLMALGLTPLAGYGMVGVGAAFYSPAKYGILTQLFHPEKLVKANGLLEGSTIAAILLGVVVGGYLADHSLSLAFGGIIALYALAALCNLFIPYLPPAHPMQLSQLRFIFKDFVKALVALFSDLDARFSLLGTSLFWASGTTLRLLLFAWVPVALLITDNKTPANLMGVVSVGIVLGAAAAGVWIRLESVNRSVWGGVALGFLIIGLAFAKTLPIAITLLALVGACGGLFVVPLNALLQERGHHSVGAGHAMAVQNLFENAGMLVFVGLLSKAMAMKVPVVATVAGFGGLLLVGMAALLFFRFFRKVHTVEPLAK